MGTLAAGVAHEINNPLAYVIANADFIAGELPQVMRILQTVDDAVAADAGRRLSELVEILADAREGAERIRNVVRDLKTFSRSDSDVAAPVAAQRVTEASINMAWNEIRHRARLVKSYRPVPPVLANESRLGQVVLNLLVNAAQALPEGRAADNEIRVSIDTDGHDVFIVVEDTGPGIAPEHLSRVFEPFFTTKPVGQGTGLGLSISRNIVQALGGDISVTSTVGRGTTFRVRLPAAPERIVAQEKTDASPAPGGSRCRILIVDDEPSVATALRRVVSNDHDVAIAGGGVAALERIEAGERFDVIFCDLMMPDMTGMELHAKLAASHKDAAERMIFVTGGAFSDGARAFLERTKNLYLEKPFDEQAIRALIRARQDSRSRGQEAVG